MLKLPHSAGHKKLQKTENITGTKVSGNTEKCLHSWVRVVWWCQSNMRADEWDTLKSEEIWRRRRKKRWRYGVLVVEEEEEKKLEVEEEEKRRRNHSSDRPAHFQHVSRHTHRCTWEQAQMASHNWLVVTLKVGQGAVLIGPRHSFLLLCFLSKRGF